MRHDHLRAMTKRVATAALLFFVCAVSLARAGASRDAWMMGVNLSGGELNPTKSRLNADYTYPTKAEIDYFAGKGLRTFRIPVLSDRLLGSAPFNAKARTADWISLSNLIDHAARSNARVIIDFHQYGRLTPGLLGRDEQATREFAEAWEEVARRLKDRPNVIFGLMNEPHEQSASEWLSAANAAIAAIRRTGAPQLILVPGSSWTGAHAWTTTDNAKTMGDVVDPAHNFTYEVHQYLDADSSGTKPDVVAGAGAARLAAFTAWARQRRATAFLGEMGWAATPAARAEGRALLAYMAANRDVWRGWTYWAAGPWWGEYMFSVEPRAGVDRPQMEDLEAASRAVTDSTHGDSR